MSAEAVKADSNATRGSQLHLTSPQNMMTWARRPVSGVKNFLVKRCKNLNAPLSEYVCFYVSVTASPSAEEKL